MDLAVLKNYHLTSAILVETCGKSYDGTYIEYSVELFICSSFIPWGWESGEVAVESEWRRPTRETSVWRQGGRLCDVISTCGTATLRRNSGVCVTASRWTSVWRQWCETATLGRGRRQCDVIKVVVCVTSSTRVKPRRWDAGGVCVTPSITVGRLEDSRLHLDT